MKYSHTWFKILAVPFLGMVLLFLCETLIRITGRYQVYSEKTKGTYSSYYNQVLPTHYLLHKPMSEFVLDHKEFRYSYKINRQGVRERDLNEKKCDSCKRLFVLGDSFTEGVGAPYDSTFVRFLASGLNGFEVFNCGVTGNDPVYEFKWMRDKLLGHHPTHVVMMINHSDLEDLMFRGGEERFYPDGTTHYTQGPVWEPIYRYSHFFRLLIHEIFSYNRLLQLSDKEGDIRQKAEKQLIQTLSSFSGWCSQNNISFLVVVQPDPGEICMKMKRITELENLFTEASFPVVSAYSLMKHLSEGSDCFKMGWPEDGHFNSKGYALLAEAVKAEINRKYPDFWSGAPQRDTASAAKSN